MCSDLYVSDVRYFAAVPGPTRDAERVSSLDFNHVLVNEFSWYGFHTMLALKHESLKSMSCIIETQSFA